jgi:hypothetical protein
MSFDTAAAISGVRPKRRHASWADGQVRDRLERQPIVLRADQPGDLVELTRDHVLGEEVPERQIGEREASGHALGLVLGCDAGESIRCARGRSLGQQYPQIVELVDAPLDCVAKPHTQSLPPGDVHFVAKALSFGRAPTSRS